MSSRFVALVGTTLLLVLGRVAAAQSITVNPGSAGPLTVTTAVAGQQPTSVQVGGGTYTLQMKKNKGIGSITARLSAALPPGTTLWIILASPGGGVQSMGAVPLTTSPQNVIANIPNLNTSYPASAITYTLNATTTAGVVALNSVSVILDLAP